MVVRIGYLSLKALRHALSDTLIMVDAAINIYEEKTTATLSYLMNNLLKPTLFISNTALVCLIPHLNRHQCLFLLQLSFCQ